MTNSMHKQIEHEANKHWCWIRPVALWLPNTLPDQVSLSLLFQGRKHIMTPIHRQILDNIVARVQHTIRNETKGTT